MLNTSQGLNGIVNSIIGIIYAIIPALVALSIVLFFIGILRYIKSEGEVKDRSLMLWGLVVLFVLLSMWGLLRLMCNTLLGSSCGGGGSTYVGKGGTDTLPSVY